MDGMSVEVMPSKNHRSRRRNQSASRNAVTADTSLQRNDMCRLLPALVAYTSQYSNFSNKIPPETKTSEIKPRKELTVHLNGLQILSIHDRGTALYVKCPVTNRRLLRSSTVRQTFNYIAKDNVHPRDDAQTDMRRPPSRSSLGILNHVLHTEFNDSHEKFLQMRMSDAHFI